MLDKGLIPKGQYCYDAGGVCPYWSRNSEYPEQANGYCSFLGKGDWDMNKEKSWKMVEGPSWKNPSVDFVSADDLGLPLSLLWDQVKMCGENEDDDDDDDDELWGNVQDLAT